MRKVRSNPVCGSEYLSLGFFRTFSGATWGFDRTFWGGRRFQGTVLKFPLRETEQNTNVHMSASGYLLPTFTRISFIGRISGF